MTEPSHPPRAETGDEHARFFPEVASADEAAMARWRAAEGRLYPLIMVDPELYEAAVNLVCEATEVLREQCATIAELVSVDSAGVLGRCPSAPALTTASFGIGSAFDAACARRSRELAASATDR